VAESLGSSCSTFKLLDEALVNSPTTMIFKHFSIYTSAICEISRIHNVQQQQYADDTQLYVAVTPTEPNDQISALLLCNHVWSLFRPGFVKTEWL